MNRRSLLKKGAVGSFVAIAGCFGLGAMAGDEESESSGGSNGGKTTQPSQDDQSNSQGNPTQSTSGGQESTSQPDSSSGGNGGSSKSGPSGTINGADEIEVLSASWYTETLGTYGIKGKLKNTSESKLMGVETQVHYFDSSGTRIGEGMDMVSDFAPDSTATFETMGAMDSQPEDVAEWELTVKVTDL